MIKRYMEDPYDKGLFAVYEGEKEYESSPWVEYSDYEALESRHRALVEALTKIETGNQFYGIEPREIARKALQEDNK